MWQGSNFNNKEHSHTEGISIGQMLITWPVLCFFFFPQLAVVLFYFSCLLFFGFFFCFVLPATSHEVNRCFGALPGTVCRRLGPAIDTFIAFTPRISAADRKWGGGGRGLRPEQKHALASCLPLVSGQYSR